MLLNNIRFNYIAQIYTIIVSVIFVPYFMKTLGNEAYGLIGFFSSMQAWIALLDMGLTSIVLRETSKYVSSKDNEIVRRNFSYLLNILNLIFLVLSIVIFVGIFCTKNYLVENWLTFDKLSRSDISFSIVAMGAFVSLKWISGLYRAVIFGVENFKKIAIINIFVTTIRYVLIIPVFYFFDKNIKVFFIIQVIAAIFESVFLYTLYKNVIPNYGINFKEGLNSLKSLLGFSSYAGMISILYVVSTQFDKIYLSKVLDLNTYGLFSFAIVFATLINMMAAPVQHALQPRLTKYFLKNDRNKFAKYYKSIFIIFSITIIFISGSVILLVRPILFLLSYDTNEITEVFKIVSLYSAGNAFFAISSLSYFMQYSQGIIKYHFYGVVWFSGLYILSVMMFAGKYSYVATGFSWVFLNAIYVLCWLPFVNNKILNEYSAKSYFIDLSIILLPFLFILSFSMYLLNNIHSTVIIDFCALLLYFTFFVFSYRTIFIKNFNYIRKDNVI